MRLAGFTLVLMMTLFFLVAGCKASPPPPVGAPPQAFAGRNINQGGTPDEAKFMNIVCPPFEEIKGMIFDKTTKADTYTVRGMKCKVKLSRHETISLDVVVVKDKNLLFFGTMFKVRDDPRSYQTAYKIIFTYPGCKDVVFINVPIIDGQIEVPAVDFQSAK